MLIQIKTRFDESVIFEHEAEENSFKIAIEVAIKSGILLRNAILYGADLRNADLRNADLRNADLRNADLRNADLYGAILYGADLRNADLRNADLRNADLRNADLRNADLYGEKLSKTPIQLNNLKWPVIITEKHLKIGCQLFTVEEWRNFTDEEIVEMNFGALKFWRKWKQAILALCDTHKED